MKGYVLMFRDMNMFLFHFKPSHKAIINRIMFEKEGNNLHENEGTGTECIKLTAQFIVNTYLVDSHG